MAALQIRQFPCLNDNYGYLIHDPDSGETAALDTPDPAVILSQAEAAGWRITHIWNTHHHGDHAGGNVAIKEATGCVIVGPRADAARIPGLDEPVGDGDVTHLGDKAAQVFDTPGHTRGHIVYLFKDERKAFVGDTLFALGCGRLFEGTPAQMWASLSKILAWPDDTLIHCAHEYTQANARFALTVEPDNAALTARAAWIDEARAHGGATVPSTLAEEKATNPFLRPDSPGIRAQLGLETASNIDVFAEIRRRKDVF